MNEALQLPDYFQKTQFTARIGETERKQATEFCAHHFADGKLPATSREFLNAIFAMGAGLQGKPKVENEWNEIPTKTLLAAAEDENRQLKTEIELLKSGKPEIDFSIFEDERLNGFAAFRLPEHTHPFETIARLKFEADKSIVDYERARYELELEPLRCLEPDEYDVFKKWVEETFVPGMRTITGIEKLVLTNRHQFMMMFDYCQADPITEVIAMFPNATPAQKEKLNDMQFPRASCVAQVLADITETIENNSPDAQPKPIQEETKIIDINAGKSNGLSFTAADGEHGNKPEQ